MIGLVIVVAMLLLISVYILFAPFFIEINSSEQLCRFRFHGLLQLDLIAESGTLNLKVWVLGINWKKDLLKADTKNVAVGKKTKKIKIIRKKRSKITLSKILKVIQTFKIKNLRLIIDTGDMALNGKLYPLFLFARNRLNKTIAINFNGENVLEVSIENRIIRILNAWIKS